MGLTQLKFTAQMENLPSFLIALGLSSVCTQGWLNKKTIKWPRAGKEMLKEFAFSWVPFFLSLPTPLNQTYIQAGLFSATIAIFLSVSIQDLKSNSQDLSAFYLGEIYQRLADPNTSVPTSSVPVQRPVFSPPTHAVWVNSLWILSLAISLTCALQATMLHQWARRYLDIAQPSRCSPHRRARIHAFFSDGVDKSHLPTVAEALPTLLHLALFHFFAGLLIYLFNANHTVFTALIWWLGLSAAAYACITLMPVFRSNSPYYTPLSSLICFLRAIASQLVFHIFRLITSSIPHHNAPRKRADDINDRIHEELSSELDGQILKRTVDSLTDDYELEKFFAAVPGFFDSKLVDAPQHILDGLPRKTFVGALSGFLDRTLASNLVSESVKARRLVVCFDAADAAFTGIDREFFHNTLSGRWGGVLQSVEIGNYLKTRANNRDRETDLYTQSILAGVIANVRKRDNHWLALAQDQLHISGEVLQDYVARGDSVLLANLINIIPKILRTFEGDHYSAYISSRILRSVSQFDILRTLPKLQHDFCALWNDVVQEAWKSGSDSTPIYILRYIRHLYIALHQGTDASPTLFSSSTADHDDVLSHDSSYPLCGIAGHHPDVP